MTEVAQKPTGDGPEPATRQPGGEDPTAEDPSAETYGISFWIGLVVGGAVMAYAVWGIFHDHLDTNPPFLLKWVLGVLFAHDFVIAPVVAVGVVLVRRLPDRVRHPVGGALAMTGIVVVFSIPLVRAFGRHELNSSTLPHDYLPNVLVVVAVIWATAGAAIVWRSWRRTT